MPEWDATQIAKIVRAEIEKELATRPSILQENIPKPGSRNILVIFTGSDIGLPAALEQLQKLRQKSYSFTFLLSRAAQKIIGTEKITSVTKDCQILTDIPAEKVLSFVQEQVLIIVPTLSRTTAIKLASAITDTLVTDLLYTALVNKKPIIAARNGADPMLSNCPRCGTSDMAPAMIQNIHTELDKLIQYGIRLISVDDLADETVSILESIPREIPEKQIITEQDIKSAANAGEKRIRIRKGSIVTPLAKDTAKELGIEIEFI
ncbi:MAG: flavoprotein [bacterium]|nr:flavoprotein [bacterium]